MRYCHLCIALIFCAEGHLHHFRVLGDKINDLNTKSRLKFRGRGQEYLRVQDDPRNCSRYGLVISVGNFEKAAVVAE